MEMVGHIGATLLPAYVDPNERAVAAARGGLSEEVFGVGRGTHHAPGIRSPTNGFLTWIKEKFPVGA